MPELPITVNANITRIDAPFPEEWREEFFQFNNEIAAIKQLLTNVAASLTTSNEAQQALANLYTKEAVAERASQAIASEQSQQRLVGPNGEDLLASRPPVTSPEEEKTREEKQQPSTPPDSEKGILDQPIQMPQHYGGKYTAEDLLKLMGKGTRKISEKAGIFTGIGEPAEWLSQKFAKGAELQPSVSAVYNLGKTYTSAAKNWSEGFGQYAGSLGYEAGGGFMGLNNVEGPLGTHFRVPLLNSSALSGIAQTAEAYQTALTVPGLSGSQVMAMNQSLAERGWYPGQSQQQELFDVQAKLIGKGGVVQQLGENPEVANLIDHAMRSGNAGAEEMLRTIQEIPEAAKNAHEGMDQMVQSMNEFGELSQSQGGTHFAGQQQALQLANTTGLPNAAVKNLIESPWAQSAVFRETGVPSWAQGTVPGAIKNKATIDSFFSLANAVGKGEGHTYKSGPFETHVSGIEEQAARIHMLIPSMPPETIQRMLREGKRGMEGRSEVQSEAEGWKQLAEEVVERGNPTAAKQLLTAGNVGNKNFGRLLHDMAEQKTEDGRRMFSHEDIKMIRNNWNRGYGDLHGKELVEARYSALEKVLGKKSGKDSNAAGSPGNVTIELSPAARKLLQLPNKRSRIKIEAGAGENSTVNGFTGSSDPLVPTFPNSDHPNPLIEYGE